MDPLVELPLEQWPILQRKLRERWPINVAAFYALDLNIKHPGVREAFQFKVYCPQGNIENGFVGTSFKDAPECVTFPTTEDSKLLEESLTRTKILDWRKNVCVDAVTSSVLDMWQRIIPRIGINKCIVGRVKTFFLDRNTKPFYIESCPDAYLGPLKLEHTEEINDKWPYKHSSSIQYFDTLTLNGLGYGLYLKSTNELVAWVFFNEYYFICHLFCVIEYRKRGYAEFLMKSIINDRLRNNSDLYTYVEESNEISSNLFTKLGFSNIDSGAYLYVQNLTNII